ncbi:hypothetical protein IFM89_033593 [Coptis chinensis]|uniref:Retrotransposon Copia-like N-terminal domain-containing protein n=1 Tax=Coptis chinensis TaxID=261450 RepID=A0A835M2D6_9MAGN|nr:hypothetical protein IFM89_033593 [Coptis chinensis]
MMSMDTPIDVVVPSVNSNTNVNAQSVTLDKLNGNNFKTWSRAIVHYLTSKGVEGLVDGTYIRPSETEEKKYSQWKKHNSRRRMLRHSNSPTLMVQGLADHSTLAFDSSQYRSPSKRGCGRGHGGRGRGSVVCSHCGKPGHERGYGNRPTVAVVHPLHAQNDTTSISSSDVFSQLKSTSTNVRTA